MLNILATMSDRNFEVTMFTREVPLVKDIIHRGCRPDATTRNTH